MDFLDIIGAVVGAVVRLFGWLLLPWPFGPDLASQPTSSSRTWRNVQALASWVRVLFWLALAGFVCWALWQLPN